MPFPFTFISNVPGIINPFAASDSVNNSSNYTIRAPSQNPVQEPNPALAHNLHRDPPTIPRSQFPKTDRPRPPPSLETPSRSPTPVSRKRGWHPSFVEPSTSSTNLTSTSGYISYPQARSGEHFMGSVWSQLNPSSESDQHEGEEMPPLKKRRGLAGAIISTAVNAALIGSAVGLTVYRLWRNRGKLPQEQQQVKSVSDPSLHTLPPPPPYEDPSHYKQDFNVPPPVHVVPPSTPSPAKKIRHSRQNKRPATQHRRRKSHRTHPDHHQSTPSSSDPYFQNSSTTRYELEREPHNDVVEDKMDWIGDKLSMLIQQGKRALNAEVVVSSDAIEDEVDDGSDAWEEENDMGKTSLRHSRSGSVRHCKRPPTLDFGSGQSTSTIHHIHHASHRTTYSSSPRFADFNFPVSSSVPNTSLISGGINNGYSTFPASQSTTSLNITNVEDPSTFESPELRESMEKARQRLMLRRLGGA